MELTREKVVEMEAGEELDALVTEYVMGRLVTWNRSFQYLSDEEKKSDMRSFVTIPEYSTDISAAWEVAEKFHQFTVMRSSGWKEQYDCRIWVGITGEQWAAQAKTAPLAICRAALLTTLKEE